MCMAYVNRTQRCSSIHLKRTLFSMEHKAKLQPFCTARLHRRASIHSDLPEFGTPVTTDSSPGTTLVDRATPAFHQALLRNMPMPRCAMKGACVQLTGCVDACNFVSKSGQEVTCQNISSSLRFLREHRVRANPSVPVQAVH